MAAASSEVFVVGVALVRYSVSLSLSLSGGLSVVAEEEGQTSRGCL